MGFIRDLLLVFCLFYFIAVTYKWENEDYVLACVDFDEVQVCRLKSAQEVSDYLHEHVIK